MGRGERHHEARVLLEVSDRRNVPQGVFRTVLTRAASTLAKFEVLPVNVTWTMALITTA